MLKNTLFGQDSAEISGRGGETGWSRCRMEGLGEMENWGARAEALTFSKIKMPGDYVGAGGWRGLEGRGQ